MKFACRVLFVLVGREVSEGYAEVDYDRVIVDVDPIKHADGTAGHTMVFAVESRGILWADASNEEEARAFRASVALR